MKRVLFVCLISVLPRLALSFDFYEETQNLMKNLNAGDSVAFFNHFQPDAKFHHVGEAGLETLALSDFGPVLKKFQSGEFREEFTKITMTDLETGLTYVDVQFNFFINNTYAFSGIDHVIWVKTGADQKIVSLFSGALKPRFTTSHGMSSIATLLDEKMNKWHNDVATFNFESYFDFMTTDFIFLGTDPAERWTKPEFEKFCQPFFEKKSTWDFKTNSRHWYISDDQNTAWFEESLDTWMEECRGTGVLKKENGIWKIAHYNLTVLIENEKTDKFIKLRKK